MSGVNPRYVGGPRSYKVHEAIKGGQVVQARTDGTVEKAATGSATVLGVALNDAQPVADQSGATTSYGMPVIDASVPQDYVTVAYSGTTVPVTYSAAATFGARLAVGATAGQVAPAAATPDARTVIGVCDEVAGVAAGAVGLMRIL